MSTTPHIPPRERSPSTHEIFADPVAFLATFGIVSVVVYDTTLPVAA